MLCPFIRTSSLLTIYVNPLKVCTVEYAADTEAQITFDNGGSVRVEGTAENTAARIGEALKALSSVVTVRE